MTHVGSAYLKAKLRSFGDFTPERLADLGVELRQPPLNPWDSEDWPQDLISPESMAELGLGVYRGDDGTWLLGSTDESLHRHERWIYLRTPLSQWLRLEHHAPEPIIVPSIASVLTGEKLSLQIMAPDGWTPSTFWRLASYKASTGQAMTQAIRSERFRAVDLHDLVYHYDVWASRNPDSTDMPRELVWRMQGLQAAYEQALVNRVDFASAYPDTAFL